MNPSTRLDQAVFRAICAMLDAIREENRTDVTVALGATFWADVAKLPRQQARQIIRRSKRLAGQLAMRAPTPRRRRR